MKKSRVKTDLQLFLEDSFQVFSLNHTLAHALIWVTYLLFSYFFYKIPTVRLGLSNFIRVLNVSLTPPVVRLIKLSWAFLL